jgi:hypothetical protein
MAATGALIAHFKPVPLKHGDGWTVLASWDSGRTAEVNGFATKAEAQAWITTESAAWLTARHTGSHD